MTRWLALGLSLVLAAAAACGEAGLRRPAECPTLAPPETGASYPDRLAAGLEQLQRLDDEFRLRWPDRRLRERPEFRADFVTYAHGSLCVAEALRAIVPEMQRYLAFDRHVEEVLGEYIAELERGWEAVDSRNRDDYSEFIAAIDELRSRIDVLAAVVSELR